MSLIDHYYHESTDFIGGATIFKISRKQVPHQCPLCNEKNGILRGKTKRLIQTVPAGFRKIFIQTPVQRVECRNCQKIYQVEIGFAAPRVSYTKALARYVLGLCQYMTINFFMAGPLLILKLSSSEVLLAFSFR